ATRSPTAGPAGVRVAASTATADATPRHPVAIAATAGARPTIGSPFTMKPSPRPGASARPFSAQRPAPRSAPCRPPPRPPVQDLDVAEERPARQHDPRTARRRRARRLNGSADLSARLQLDLDAVGDEQDHVAEEHAGVDVRLELADLRLA